MNKPIGNIEHLWVEGCLDLLGHGVLVELYFLGYGLFRLAAAGWCLRVNAVRRQHVACPRLHLSGSAHLLIPLGVGRQHCRGRVHVAQLILLQPAARHRGPAREK